ncbi:MAG: fatty acid--CoA ligase family protein [Nitrospinota bacterium]
MDWLLDRFREFGDHHAIGGRGGLYTYRELESRVGEYIKEVSKKIEKGAVAAIVSDYSFDSISLLLALAANKNIVVPIVAGTEEETSARLEESFVDVVAVPEGGAIRIEKRNSFKEKHALIEELRSGGHSGLVLFSSGSAGKPKAMLHDFDRYADSFREKKIKKSLRMLVFLMFDHMGGINTLFTALSRGATMFILDSRDPDEICAIMEKEKINVLPVSPTFLNMILISEAYKKHDLGALQTITYGTEVMPEPLLKRLNRAFPNVRFSQMFGTSETGILHTVSKSSASAFMKIDDPARKYKIVDGELWIRSSTQALGYLNAGMESFTKDGWFKTGDLVETEEDGYLRIVGRNSETINVGGEKVLPGEVESVLLEMGEVKDCVVYSQPNALTGNAVTADVVLEEGVSADSIRSLVRKYCRAKLAPYKVPARVNVVSATGFGGRFKKTRKGA